MSQNCSSSTGVPRRNFLKESAAVVIGALAGLVPVFAGVLVFLDPARRKASGGGGVRVTNLSALPADGVPRKFQVIADRVDAWNKYPDVPVGAVYLRRTGDKITALNVACPHAGCFVDFSANKGLFLCPCHNSSFSVDGTINDKNSPSPRPMDSLAVEVRDGGEVWVWFQNFQPGERAKIAVT